MGLVRALVVGVGNRMYGDDGYGDLLVEALERCGARGFETFRGSHLGLGMLGFLEGYDVLVFIDVVDPSLGGDPGNVVTMEIDPTRVPAEEYGPIVRGTDSHRVSPAHLVALLYSSGLFRGKAYLVGVVPGTLEFGRPVSETVLKATPKVLKSLESLLKSLGLENFYWDSECLVKTIRELSSRG